MGADSPAHKNAGTEESPVATCLIVAGHLMPFYILDLTPLGVVVSIDAETLTSCSAREVKICKETVVESHTSEGIAKCCTGETSVKMGHDNTSCSVAYVAVEGNTAFGTGNKQVGAGCFVLVRLGFLRWKLPWNAD